MVIWETDCRKELISSLDGKLCLQKSFQRLTSVFGKLEINQEILNIHVLELLFKWNYFILVFFISNKWSYSKPWIPGMTWHKNSIKYIQTSYKVERKYNYLYSWFYSISSNIVEYYASSNNVKCHYNISIMNFSMLASTFHRK